MKAIRLRQDISSHAQNVMSDLLDTSDEPTQLHHNVMQDTYLYSIILVSWKKYFTIRPSSFLFFFMKIPTEPDFAI